MKVSDFKECPHCHQGFSFREPTEEGNCPVCYLNVTIESKCPTCNSELSRGSYHPYCFQCQYCFVYKDGKYLPLAFGTDEATPPVYNENGKRVRRRQAIVKEKP